MALITFLRLQECLKDGDIEKGILTGQEGLHYGDIHYMPPCHSLKMQYIPFSYFSNLVSNNTFTPLNCRLKDASSMSALLLVFITSADLMSIKYVHIGLIICQAKSPL